MLDATQYAMGAWVGFAKKWHFGPLRVEFEAWLEGNSAISVKPPHYYCDIWLHGKAGLSVFGFGIGLSLDAIVATDVYDPFHILAQLKVGIKLPWPLPDINANLPLEWGRA